MFEHDLFRKPRTLFGIHAPKKNPALAHGALLAGGVGISAPGRQPCTKLKVENPKSNSAAMTEYVRQAALPYDWALKSPASMGPPQQGKGSTRRARVFHGEVWTFCSHFVLVGHLLLGGDS
ncbi:hypothetical protein [Bradyrhizobium daqingense]|uniref:hypothetical protein n=1 Tax=Bradyrhizobium daqingense TaxID=993502 RepID=UPI0011A7C28F|nr:hypothetical protein [Bradyrhizobium daqingense]